MKSIPTNKEFVNDVCTIIDGGRQKAYKLSMIEIFWEIEKITHQDVGQMDMYRRMCDDLKCTEGNNPTIGIVLCSETSQDIAKYSMVMNNYLRLSTCHSFPLKRSCVGKLKGKKKYLFCKEIKIA